MWNDQHYYGYHLECNATHDGYNRYRVRLPESIVLSELVTNELEQPELFGETRIMLSKIRRGL